MSDGNDPLLSVRKLSIDYGSPRGRVHALRGINLDISHGRIVGVVGESGCGKSTLTSAIIGLLPHNAEIVDGEILLRSRNLRKLSHAEMRAIRGREIAMIVQDPMTALNPVRTIGAQMVDVQHRDTVPAREKRKRATEMLSRVGIPDAEARLNDYPHQFSGGMRQRVCIAMALLVKPALLLADEPTAALDATLEVQIVSLLQRLQREIGCSILFVSHHLGTVATLCEDVVVMYGGEVVERGMIRDIFQRPCHPYTRALLSCDPGRLKEKTRCLPMIPGEVPNLIEVPEGCIFKGRCTYAFERCLTERPPHYSAGGPCHSASCHLLDTHVEVAS
jgi:peptide/nickel transport system ATP-binding protein